MKQLLFCMIIISVMSNACSAMEKQVANSGKAVAYKAVASPATLEEGRPGLYDHDEEDDRALQESCCSHDTIMNIYCCAMSIRDFMHFFTGF